ncbi:MAG: Glutathione transferase, partial [Chloroflexi bacterium]|nr:Glutathione transferase [Chloroflexota bacterium]
MMQTAADRDLRISYLDHFNVPVRDMNVARKFYTEVLGGVVVHEASWYLVPDRSGNGSSPGAHLDIKLFRGNGILQPYYQPWGQPSLHQVHPHGAFRAASPEAFGALIRRLSEHQIPHLLLSEEPTDASGRASASAFLRDPDMNQIEVSCTGYALQEDASAGEFDPTLQYYRWADWRAQVPYGGPPEQLLERGRG